MQDSYLKKLTFDPQLKNSWMASFLQAPRLIFLLILMLVIAGIFSYIVLPRELNPEIEIPIVTVSTALSGANPLDVEELITDKLEKEIDSLTDIDSITSTSSEGFSSIVVTFDTGVDVDQKLTAVKEKVDLVTDLPSDATTPRVNKINFNDQPVVQVALVGEIDRRSLTEIAERVQDELELLPQIRSVELSGAETEQILISLDAVAMQTYNVTTNQVSQAIQTNNLTFPVGSLQVNDTEYQLSVDGSVTTIEALRSIPLSLGSGPNVQTVLLGEVAQVSFQSASSNALTSYRTPGSAELPAIQLSIYKSTGATITDAAQLANQTLTEIVAEYPQAEVVSIYDNGEEISDQFGELALNFRDTVFLVFLTLFVFIGLRQALVASISIPLTFLAGFTIMYATGITLNFLSLFSLLLALGLVVDDAIVIVEASYRYGKKFTPLETGLLVFRDFVVPIWTTTITTVWAFLPLLLASGIIGEFIKSIPIVVSATLLSSTTIAVFINLPLIVMMTGLKVPQRVKMLGGLLVVGATVGVIALIGGSSALTLPAVLLWLLVLGGLFWARKEVRATHLKVKNNVKNRWQSSSVSKKVRLPRFLKRLAVRFNWRTALEHGVINFGVVTEKYRQALEWILVRKKARWSVYAISFLFFVTSILFLVTGLLKNEFFPSIDQKQFYVNIEGPAGWPLEKTQAVLAEVESVVLDVPEVSHLVTQTNSVYGGSFAGGQSGPHLANLTVVLSEEADRDRSSIAITQELRDKFATLHEAKVSVVELSAGPPVGADLDISIVGNDMTKLEQVSHDFMEIIATIPGAVNIDTSLKQNAGQLTIKLDPTSLQQRGLSVSQVAGTLRSAVTGFDAGEVTIGENDLDILIRFPEEQLSLSKLQNLIIQGQSGSYTLAELATISLETSPTTVEHIDLDRVVRVGAAAEGISAPELLAAFEERVADYELPSGVTWTVGGANQENQESTLSIIQAMGLSVILILLTMVLQLNSFRKSFLVLLVIPLAVAGVFFNFTLLGVPLSFPALIGVLALFGIVVNNSIMLVEKINQNIKFNLPFLDAITSACSSRIEAIFFTSLTTTMGLLPISIADPFWRGLGGAIIAGLSVSGLLILFLLPVAYYELYQDSEG